MTEFAATLGLAGLSNFHPTTVGRLERGERPVRLSEAVVIAQVLGETLDNLVVEPLTGDEEVREHMGYVEYSSMMAGRWLYGVASRRLQLEEVIRKTRESLAAGRILPEHIGEVEASLGEAGALLKREGLVDAWVARFESMSEEDFQAGVRNQSWSLGEREAGADGEHPEAR